MKEKSIGEKVREYRLKKGMTQDALAAELRVSSQAVSKWENGQTMPDISLLLPLSRALEIGVNDLLGGDRRAELERSWQQAVCLGEELTLWIAEDALKEFPDDETFLFRRACDEYQIATREGMTKGAALPYLRQAYIHFSDLHHKHPEDDTYTSFLADICFAEGRRDYALTLAYTIKDKDRRERTVAEYLGGDAKIKYEQKKLNRATNDLFYKLLQYNTRDSIQAAYALLDVMMKEGRALHTHLHYLYRTDAYLCYDEGNFDAYAEKLTAAYEKLLCVKDSKNAPIEEPNPLFDHLQYEGEETLDLSAFLNDVWHSKKMGHPASLPLRRRLAEEQLDYDRLYRHKWLAYYHFCQRCICKKGWQNFSISYYVTEQEEREGMHYYATKHPNRGLEGMFAYYRYEVERLVGDGKMRGFVAESMNDIVAYCNCGAKEKYVRLPVPEGYTEIGEGVKVFSIVEILLADNLKDCGVEEKLLNTALAFAKKNSFTHAEAYLAERKVFPGDDLEFDSLAALYRKLGFTIAYDMTEHNRRMYILQKEL